jgi:hypothetical protein
MWVFYNNIIFWKYLFFFSSVNSTKFATLLEKIAKFFQQKIEGKKLNK